MNRQKSSLSKSSVDFEDPEFYCNFAAYITRKRLLMIVKYFKCHERVLAFKR